MKGLNVRLRAGSHPLYADLAELPPDGVSYRTSTHTTVHDPRMLRRLKRFAWKHLTRWKPPAIPAEPGADLVHSCYGTMVRGAVPWVVDTEHAVSFANYHLPAFQRPGYHAAIAKLLQQGSCKAIMPWTDAGANSIRTYFNDPTITSKLDVVYPAVRPGIISKRGSGPFRLLAVNRYFLEKGGLHALRVYDLLKDRFDVELTVVSDAPEAVHKRYESDPRVRILPPSFTRPELMKNFYSQADCLLHLTFSDTFGFVILEAMSAGLPVVTTDMFSMPEVVQDGKTGLLASSGFSSVAADGRILYHQSMGNWPEFLKQVERSDVHVAAAQRVAQMIDDSSLHSKLSSGALDEVLHGRFSIGTRNTKLRAVYDRAVRI